MIGIIRPLPAELDDAALEPRPSALRFGPCGTPSAPADLGCNTQKHIVMIVTLRAGRSRLSLVMNNRSSQQPLHCAAMTKSRLHPATTSSLHQQKCTGHPSAQGLLPAALATQHGEVCRGGILPC
ncbi:hypothetical protein [Paracraurococcus ruber]|uniref:hypothetical protein n=1 Tax=Paracraurococcus ruber TaxID=77675 RepID=UPI001A934A9E|nr:hypothetical protein [Paracraurococcus ruber]